MLSYRIALSSVVILVGAAACSTSPNERVAVAEQRIESPPDGGDEADAADAGGCAHSLCATGVALEATCDECAVVLCAADPYCCNTAWDATCVGEVGSICAKSCAPPAIVPDEGASTCAHPLCATGAALVSTCEPCTTQLCAQDPYCCAIAWDATCVGEVTSICGQACN